MHTPIRATFVGLTSSRTIEHAIFAQAKVLERFADDIVHCHVHLERRGRSGQDGYRAEALLTMRGGDVVTTRSSEDAANRDDLNHDDMQEALRHAFGRVAEQLASARQFRSPAHRAVGSAQRRW